jgi:anti-sigma-K factor RskA
MKKLKRWLRRRLTNSTNLSLDVQHWRSASCWKVLIWCIAGCMAVLMIWWGAGIYLATNPEADPLVVYVCGAALVILGLMVLITLGVRIYVISACLIRRHRVRKQSSTL